MNSRERVIAALHHQEPDHVPYDMGSTSITTMIYIGMEKLRQYLGIDEPEYVCTDPHYGLAYPSEKLLDALEIDTRRIDIGMPDAFANEYKANGTHTDEWGVLRKNAELGVPYYNTIWHPLGEAETIADLDKYQWPDPDDPGRYKGLREKAKTLYHETNKALVSNLLFDGLLDASREILGLEKVMIDMYTNPDFVEEWLDRYMNWCIRVFDNFLGEVGEYLQVVCVTDDLGFQDRTALSPEMYREFLKPRHIKIYNAIKKKTKAKLFQHCCGSVYDIIPDLIEEGVDVLQPIQPLAANMQAEKLAQFKDKICFWGGIDEQHLLPYGTPEEIDAEVKRVIGILGPGGGYVPMSSHVIQHDTPPENAMALFDAIKKYGNYPIL
jgi:uroporphyrinogen decarboxylase